MAFLLPVHHRGSWRNLLPPDRCIATVRRWQFTGASVLVALLSDGNSCLGAVCSAPVFPNRIEFGLRFQAIDESVGTGCNRLVRILIGASFSWMEIAPQGAGIRFLNSLVLHNPVSDFQCDSHPRRYLRAPALLAVGRCLPVPSASC